MELKLPIKNLIRLNWLLSLIPSAIVCIFLLHDKAQTHVIHITIMTAIAIATIGLGNIYIIVVLAQRFEISSRKFKLYRYLLTYTASAIAYLIIWPTFVFFTNYVTSSSLLYDFILLGIGSVMVNSLIVVFHNFVLLQSEKAHADLEFSKLKTAHAEAANLLLKQQIHPHFLFNALNTVKALYRTDSRAGDSYIVHLANFLRASVFSHASKISILEEELSLLKDYLEMQKIRFGDALDCSISIPENILTSFSLPSFSLQPLLENAIKHNELTEEAPLKVYICKKNDRIIVSNNLQKKMVNVSSTNQGLANLAERYRIWSGDEVIIKEDDHTFSVSIKLLANENSNHRG
jgi:two-component system LytT family sensor kinase